MTAAESVRPLSRRTGTAPRVVCFPHAGGGPSAFRAWPELLGAHAQVDGVVLPGRAERLDEDPRRSLIESVEEVADAVGDVSGADLFFGHSMGALLAFEVVRTLRRRSAALPGDLVVSAARPPHVPRASRVHERPVEAVADELRRLGGTPDVLLADDEARDIFLPVVHADFTAVERYTFAPEPPLPVRLTVIGGRDDPDVHRAHLDGWLRQAGDAGDVRQYAGGHFFLHEESTSQVLDLVTGLLADRPPDHQTPTRRDRQP